MSEIEKTIEVDDEGFCINCKINHNCINCDVMSELELYHTSLLKVLVKEKNHNSENYCGCGMPRGKYPMCRECYIKSKIYGNY